jgi:hypothetical protein
MDRVLRPVRMTHLWRWCGDQMVIFSDATFNVRRFDLNLVGGLAWELADGYRTVEAIINDVAAKFPKEPEAEVRGCILAFFHELEGEWLITTQEALASYE